MHPVSKDGQNLHLTFSVTGIVHTKNLDAYVHGEHLKYDLGKKSSLNTTSLISIVQSPYAAVFCIYNRNVGQAVGPFSDTGRL